MLLVVLEHHQCCTYESKKRKTKRDARKAQQRVKRKKICKEETFETIDTACSRRYMQDWLGYSDLLLLQDISR
jgi:hypothetical protein